MMLVLMVSQVLTVDFTPMIDATSPIISQDHCGSQRQGHQLN
ncbi:MAG: hypothetical protein ACK5QS_14075 [Pseudanabaenaceae cyanobacterium]